MIGVSSAVTTGGVTVQTTDILGAPTDEPFHLTVTCP